MPEGEQIRGEQEELFDPEPDRAEQDRQKLLLEMQGRAAAILAHPEGPDAGISEARRNETSNSNYDPDTVAAMGLAVEDAAESRRRLLSEDRMRIANEASKARASIREAGRALVNEQLGKGNERSEQDEAS